MHIMLANMYLTFVLRNYHHHKHEEHYMKYLWALIIRSSEQTWRTCVIHANTFCWQTCTFCMWICVWHICCEIIITTNMKNITWNICERSLIYLWSPEQTWRTGVLCTCKYVYNCKHKIMSLLVDLRLLHSFHLSIKYIIQKALLVTLTFGKRNRNILKQKMAAYSATHEIG